MGVKTIKTYAERMKSEGVQRAIMVVAASLTPFARTCLAELQPKFHIEVFTEVRLRQRRGRGCMPGCLKLLFDVLERLVGCAAKVPRRGLHRGALQHCMALCSAL